MLSFLDLVLWRKVKDQHVFCYLIGNIFLFSSCRILCVVLKFRNFSGIILGVEHFIMFYSVRKLYKDSVSFFTSVKFYYILVYCICSTYLIFFFWNIYYQYLESHLCPPYLPWFLCSFLLSSGKVPQVCLLKHWFNFLQWEVCSLPCS